MVEHRYLNWRDDPNTTTDDFLVKSAALNDLISTVTGSLVAVIGAIAPIIVAVNGANGAIDTTTKVVSVLGAGIAGGAGTLIARQQPKSLQEMSKSRLKQKSQSTEEEF